MPENRTYSEQEIAALLQRSAQLQADDARSEKNTSEGLTLNELEAIAGESGLDPAYLHRAALEMEMSSGKATMPKKTETHIYADRFFTGELTDDIWEEIVFELRRKYESSTAEMYGSTIGKGISEQIGRSREWRITSVSGVQTSILFRPYKKGTRIELSQRVGIGSTRTESIAYGVFTAVFPALIALAATKSPAWGAASFAAFSALFIPIVYYLDTAWRNKKLRQLNETGDRLVDLMQSRAYSSPVEPVERASEAAGSSTMSKAAKKKASTQGPLLDLSEVEELTESAGGSGSHSRSQSQSQMQSRTRE